MLSLMYSGGEGVPEDHKEAVKWIRRAAEAGHEDAQFDLGWLYDSGSVGVPQDHNEAVKWYRRAAEQGNAKAQYNLGQSYVRGEGVPEDYKEAVKWFRRAAEQGLPDAQHSLGVLYDHGGGVPQNPSEAAKWYQRAGEQGFPMAQKELGRAYALGRGVPEDLVAAYMWFNLAASQQSGSEAEDTRRLRDIVAAQLTPSQLATAQRLSREWRPKPAVKADSSRSSSVASRPSQPVTNVPESAGSGSGFVVTRRGHILTNAHVIEGCGLVQVGVNSTGHHTAQVVATDLQNDLALLRITPGAPAVASFRQGALIRQGERVIAMGFPLHGLLASAPNLTSGAVSAVAGIGMTQDISR
jgi:Trypsin-like peptidase domain/Sel1 repeat